MRPSGTFPGFAGSRGLPAELPYTRSALLSLQDASAPIYQWHRLIVTGAAFTAARTVYLPPASSVPARTEIVAVDAQGTLTATNTLTLSAFGSDTINGAATALLDTANASGRLISDGVSKWAFEFLPPFGTSAGQAVRLDSSARLPAVNGSLLTNLAASTVVGISDTQTLTNKRVTPRVVTVTQSATPAINTDNTDTASITGLAQAITSMTSSLTGTPLASDKLIIEITDNATARAITWGASFEPSTVALPTTTVLSAKLTVGFIYNGATSKWRCVATA